MDGWNEGNDTAWVARTRWMDGMKEMTQLGVVRTRWMDGMKEMTQLGLSELGGWTE